MGIYQAEEELFDEWQGSRIGFDRDGIVSETDYLSSQLKIAFISHYKTPCYRSPQNAFRSA